MGQKGKFYIMYIIQKQNQQKKQEDISGYNLATNFPIPSLFSEIINI